MLRPMLAAKAPEDLNYLSFPVMVSPKLDGIRILITEEGPRTRKGEEIPNHHVRKLLSFLPVGFDGEVTSGPINDVATLNRTQSAVSKHDGEPQIAFHVFDDFSLPDLPYMARYARVLQRIKAVPHPWCVALPHETVHTLDDLMKWEQEYVSQGFEGLMMRSVARGYKFGRSTVKEGGLLKVKRFHDAEAIVVGIKEEMRNDNELEVNALGYAKRSTKKENKVGKGVLGALVCVALLREDETGYKNGPCIFSKSVEFDVGSGFTAAQRAALWKDPPLGKRVKFKYQGLTPDELKPRFPTFLGFRESWDMS